MELIAVMLVIATVLAMASPSLRGFFASRRTEDAARRLLAMTRQARSAAISGGQTYCLRFQADQGLCQLAIREGGADRLLETSMGRAYRLPAGVTMEVDGVTTTGGLAEVFFHPTGTCTAATIRVDGRQDDSYTVRCASATELFTMERTSDQ